VAFIWFRAQKDTAPYSLYQDLILINPWFLTTAPFQAPQLWQLWGFYQPLPLVLMDLFANE